MDAHHPDDLDRLREGELIRARELRLPGLSEFPRDILGLAETLEILDLSGGTLPSLPRDLGRLGKLRVLFCSGNRFTRLPPVLGDCRSLVQVGFRATGLREVPGEALPPDLRWPTLTDNRIEGLPVALGERPRLQKLMLAGNALRDLPPALAGAANLELIRLAANRLERLPPWLAEMPSLTWGAWSGNPFECAPEPGGRSAPWTHLSVGRRLGEGTSGRVHRAIWRTGGEGEGRLVAIKLFKGAMTSDGLPESEIAACLEAGDHPNLTSALARITGLPGGSQGLVMPIVPAGWRQLAGPPSLVTCSRDVYAPELRLDRGVALRVARGIAAAAAHLHARGWMHGDLYGHNILWDAGAGEAVLGDSAPRPASRPARGAWSSRGSRCGRGGSSLANCSIDARGRPT